MFTCCFHVSLTSPEEEQRDADTQKHSFLFLCALLVSLMFTCCFHVTLTSPVDDLCMLSSIWHPIQPWLITAGADGRIALFTD
ncbi:unnamed protein product [Caenorhabditis auriculariae]|uniref:Uncharacterized protein n=1 Tax=Caenorhabditis auriculariae TaxID=2777116 RepID=A0A8S1HMJ3_9PELO|nr:unnamed protein product [Caenorhabditis auriculariae]